jgi:hypothetical protein
LIVDFKIVGQSVILSRPRDSFQDVTEQMRRPVPHVVCRHGTNAASDPRHIHTHRLSQDKIQMWHGGCGLWLFEMREGAIAELFEMKLIDRVLVGY